MNLTPKYLILLRFGTWMLILYLVMLHIYTSDNSASLLEARHQKGSAATFVWWRILWI